MSAETLSQEVDRNFDFFQRTLGRYLTKHLGQYALLRRQTVIGFYDEPGEAAKIASGRFPDGLYSIQEVADEPVHLGLYSNAGH